MRKQGTRKMEIPADGERCKRTGTNWRCPEKALPDKIYCEKHYFYFISRNNRRKFNTSMSGGVSAVECESSAAVVEPYRPVIDFGSADVDGGGGGGVNVGSFLNEGEIMRWLLGEVDGGSCGNDNSAIPELGIGFFGSVGASDGAERREDGDFVLSERIGNDKSAPDGFSEGSKCENQELIVEANDIKCGENSSGQKFGISEMTGTCVWNKTVSLGEGLGGKIGEVGCNEHVIVMAMEAKSGLVGGGQLIGQGQKRKRGRSTGPKQHSNMALNGDAIEFQG